MIMYQGRILYMLHLVMLCIVALLVYHRQSQDCNGDNEVTLDTSKTDQRGLISKKKKFMAVQRKHDVQIHPLVKQVFFDNQ